MQVSTFLAVAGMLSTVMTMASSKKTANSPKSKSSIKWMPEHAAKAASEGWHLQEVFLPDGLFLGLRIFPLDDRKLAEVNQHVRRRAAEHSPLHVLALRCIVHSQLS